MFDVKGKHGEWVCLHSFSITKCLECQLIYCGECYDCRIKKKKAGTAMMVNCCPKCFGTLVVKLSPDMPHYEEESKQTVVAS